MSLEMIGLIGIIPTKICCSNLVHSVDKNRDVDAAPITWDRFSETFLDMFFPIKLREPKSHEFMNLMQGKMMVQEYGLKFNQLYRYAPHMVAES